MNFGSLFTGIGGLDLGLERAGMTCAFQCEIDDYATKVLERHWPDVPRWRDIADFIADAADVRPIRNEHGRNQESPREEAGRLRESCGGGAAAPEWVDVIAGGFPCQPVSVAGQRRGMADERWLWNSFREVVRIIRPRYVLVENVPGLLSAKDAAGRRGGLLGGILRDLAGMFYDARGCVLPAAAFGAPHLRKRVFVVAYAQQHRPQGSESTDGQATTVRRRSPESAAAVATDTAGAGLQERDGLRSRGQGTNATIEAHQWRATEPTIRRGDHGIPARVDRLRCLGNAVVPAVAEWIGRRILASA